jgi:steroid 5-alpha reductase family enzyme
MLRERHIIDFYKFLSLPFVLFVIYFFGREDNITIWIYAALHGSYGLLWFLKSYYFADSQWEREVTVISFVKLNVGLISYWAAPVVIATNNTIHTPQFLFCCIFIYAVGVFLHFASDMQKTTSIRLKPGHLITTGLWSYSRNPNYVGEAFIYCSFALLAWHWLPAFCLGSIMAIAWVPNMLNKDKSLSRYKEFAKYKEDSGLFFPKRIF